MTPHAPAQPTSAPSAHASAVQDSVIRLALGMWAADKRSTITAMQRDWILARLQPPDPEAPWRPFTAHEKARLYEDLMVYITAYHPRIVEIVRSQFYLREGPPDGAPGQAHA